MGYIRHRAIVVTSWNHERLKKAHLHAKTIFTAAMISGLITSPVNGYVSFFVAPDGSEEGWRKSTDGDANRDTFVRWLETQRYADGSTWLAWAEIQYGDEGGGPTTVLRDSDAYRRT